MNKIKGKIIPLTNPNYEMKETPSELLEIVKRCSGIPIINTCLFNNVNIKSENYQVIGIVETSDLYIKDGFIWGDIIFLDDKEYKWANTEIQVDENMNTIKILAVEYQEQKLKTVDFMSLPKTPKPEYFIEDFKTKLR